MIRLSFLLAFFAFSTLVFAQEKTETVFGKGGLQPVRLTGFWLEWQPFFNRTGFGSNLVSRFSGSFELNRAFEIGAALESSHAVFVPISQSVRLDWTDGWSAFLSYRFREKKLVHPFARVSFGNLDSGFEDNSSTFNDFQIFRFGHLQTGFEINFFRWLRLGLTGGYFFTENVVSPTLGNLNLDGFTIGAQLRVGILRGGR